MNFCFAIHNHQPIGNFDEVFESAYERAYRPFLETLAGYPEIRFSVHISGPLLDWLERRKTSYIDTLARLIDDERVEILSSGYYEPIIAAISYQDKVGQIELMNEYLRRRFGRKPLGLWLTERIWEPSLAKPLVDAGIRYIALDDYHFTTTSHSGNKLSHYYLTEEEGHTLAVFPISQRLRYAMPFDPPWKTLQILKKSAKSADAIAVMADDGEKFGAWPDTWEIVYGKGKWLDRFCRLLLKNQDWLKTTTFSHCLNDYKAHGRVYLPTSSYFEMSGWTLPVDLGRKFVGYLEELRKVGRLDDVRSFLRGGFWRDFLTKYEESNWMHKRASELSRRVQSRSDNDESRIALFKSQCNCAYWHGVFGGLYLPHLRQAIYEQIILADKLLHGGKRREILDLDKDGRNEVVLANGQFQIFAHQIGGVLREVDFLPRNFNLVNTLKRYEETYHQDLRRHLVHSDLRPGSIHGVFKVKEPGLNRLLIVDDHLRTIGLDHFLSEEITPEMLKTNKFSEQGDFVTGEYSIDLWDNAIYFRREGLVSGQKVLLEKTITLEGNVIGFKIVLTNLEGKAFGCNYACESNLSLLGGDAPDRYILIDGQRPLSAHLASSGSAVANEIALVCEWEELVVTFRFKDPTRILRYPVETVSMSEGGFERVYQSTTIVPIWPVLLEPGIKSSIRFELSARSEEL